MKGREKEGGRADGQVYRICLQPWANRKANRKDSMGEVSMLKGKSLRSFRGVLFLPCAAMV